MSPRMLLLTFLAAITLLRWVLIAPGDLSPEDAYAALCGFTAAVATFDGPAATSICVAWGTMLGGSSALGAALLWPLFAAFATLALYLLVKPVAGRPAAYGAAVLLNLLPAFNNAALAPSNALPLAMLSTAFLACAWRALDNDSVPWWISAGLCAGAALLFTYAAWFLLPALALVLLLSHRWRRQLLKPGFWLSIFPALGVFGLLLAWNASHGWVHFIDGTLQTATTLQWGRLPGGLLAATVGLSPLVFAALIAGLAFAASLIRIAPKAKFLTIPALVALLLTVYAVLQGRDAETPGLVAIALLLPLLAWLPPTVGRYSLTLVFVSAAIWTASMIALRPAHAPSLTPEVVREIERLRRAESAPITTPAFLIAENAPLASILALHLPNASFVLPGHPPVYVPESPYPDSQYALWPRYDQFVDAQSVPQEADDDPYTEQDGTNPFIGRSALYVTTQSPEQLPQSISAAFSSWRLLAEIVTPSGQILRIYLCSDYETLPL
ncbi:MAG: glycosyltransferase family 39 protein [Chthoniobacterales bacterium]|nr:glycosyltransferase family 39 protein [Chthoniobacterales bacterium]